MGRLVKYSDVVTDWLVELGYRKCFFVAGGNIMHLIESFSKKFEMVPVIHEVSAVIAADYYNEKSSNNHFEGGRALALVTVGPGVTNMVSGLAGAFIDSREVLVIGGQVKTVDLKSDSQRQRGVQEIDGVRLVNSISKHAYRLVSPLSKHDFQSVVRCSGSGRKGPVYLEVCLDVQGAPVASMDFLAADEGLCEHLLEEKTKCESVSDVLKHIRNSMRPLILLGGGFPRSNPELIKSLEKLGMPVATTWHGADRIDSGHPLYAGRPNMFGQRWANVVIQQTDLLIVLGSTLAYQQTGFNVKEFAKKAIIIHVDIDKVSLTNSNFPNSVKINLSISEFLEIITQHCSNLDLHPHVRDWLKYIAAIRTALPLVETSTKLQDWVNQYEFIEWLSSVAPRNLTYIPCSSGGTYVSAMQVLELRDEQTLISSKGLGSMGVGLAGAIGACFVDRKLVWLLDGDGGFLQNSQELGTVAINELPIKIILFDNEGYASIRSTQRKYFAGNYVGCDSKTGLGVPNYRLLAQSYNLCFNLVEIGYSKDKLAMALLDDKPRLILVKISPEQQYLPKIDSRINQDGSMESNPLHIMSPAISQELESQVLRYI